MEGKGKRKGKKGKQEVKGGNIENNTNLHPIKVSESKGRFQNLKNQDILFHF